MHVVEILLKKAFNMQLRKLIQLSDLSASVSDKTPSLRITCSDTLLHVSTCNDR